MRGASHTAIRESLLARIQSGEWALGAMIPGEADLAQEYGCARATVNRALRLLAEEGMVERKRKGGTRVHHLPVRQAKLDIPVIREQVEQLGSAYRHDIVARQHRGPPPSIRTRLRIPAGEKALYLETLHLADERPYAFEARWVNLRTAPDILNAPLDTVSANEWLVQTVPFSSGDVMFYAVSAGKHVASAIETHEGAAVFVIDRTTWLGEDFITATKLYHREGYRLYSRF